MRLDAIPVFSALKDALDYNSARSRVLAVNVANSDTPGFTPQDIAEGDFAAALGEAQTGGRGRTVIARTNPGHMAPPTTDAEIWRVAAAPDSETTLDGNAVVLEEQMAKVAETRMRYEAALGLYQKTLGLIRIAGKAPNR
ncbi:MAG: flagellar basal body rod protein [Maricaulaceae bacterium]|jgi:flagellar basal-body rod protein FlgB